jgi:hypothetical protein
MNSPFWSESNIDVQGAIGNQLFIGEGGGIRCKGAVKCEGERHALPVPGRRGRLPRTDGDTLPGKARDDASKNVGYDHE